MKIQDHNTLLIQNNYQSAITWATWQFKKKYTIANCKHSRYCCHGMESEFRGQIGRLNQKIMDWNLL